MVNLHLCQKRKDDYYYFLKIRISNVNIYTTSMTVCGLALCTVFSRFQEENKREKKWEEGQKQAAAIMEGLLYTSQVLCYPWPNVETPPSVMYIVSFQRVSNREQWGIPLQHGNCHVRHSYKIRLSYHPQAWLFIQKNIKQNKLYWIWWLALLPPWQGPFIVEFACSPCACVGFLQGLWLSPSVQRHAC